MKRITYIITIVESLLTVAAGSKKEIGIHSVTSPGQSYIPEIANIKTSEWFTVTEWHTESSNGMPSLVYNKNVPEMSANFLIDGKVLVFIKGGSEMKDPTALPSIVDEHAAGVERAVWTLKFVLI